MVALSLELQRKRKPGAGGFSEPFSPGGGRPQSVWDLYDDDGWVNARH